MASLPLKIATGVVVTVLAAAAVLSSLSAIVRGNALTVALRTGWASGRVYEMRADLAYWTSPANPPWRDIDSLSRAALRKAPLSPRALSLIGYSREAHGEKSRVRHTFWLSQRLSRRDIASQVWLSNQAALAGDAKAALSHFNIALTTKPESSAILFPVLAKALATSEIQQEFGATVRARPEWLAGALIYLAGNTADPQDVARAIALAGGLPATDEYQQAEGILLSQLAARSGPAAARNFYLTLHGAEKSVPVSLSFTKASVDPLRQPMTWQLSSTSNLAANIVSEGRETAYALNGSATPQTSGVLASKLLFLSPGSYRLRARTELSGDRPALQGVLNCMQEASPVEVWRRPLVAGTAVQSVFVPANCPVQRFELILRNDSGEQQADLQVFSLSLESDAPRP